MKNFAKTAVPLACALVLWLVVSFIPLIPIESAPVVPDPIFTSTFISMQGVLAQFYLVGMQFHATWATLPVMLAVNVAAIFAGWKLGRRFTKQERSVK